MLLDISYKCNYLSKREGKCGSQVCVCVHVDCVGGRRVALK